jgi:hypothetical protein
MASPPKSPSRAKRIDTILSRKKENQYPGKKVIFDFGNEKLEISASVMAYYSVTISNQMSDFPDANPEIEIRKTISSVTPSIMEGVLKYLDYRYNHEDEHISQRTEIKDKNGITSYSATDFLSQEKVIIDEISLAKEPVARVYNWNVTPDKKLKDIARQMDVYNTIKEVANYLEIPVLDDFVDQLMAKELDNVTPVNEDTLGYALNKPERLDVFSKYVNQKNFGYIPGIDLKNFLSTEELYQLLTRYGDVTDYLELTNEQKKALVKKYGKDVYEEFLPNEYNDNKVPAA